ncbi:MAG: mevalonate kinase [Crenarchaeota archaeon]|nr:MAG: mevalonate kinase [Thermoproteota archaeon]RDJ33545.1 MAG: mevalonate kinase [Thermoproteota archaeon]RDJ38133.1 MAG: mevalonate kinase [Thermoproteota archaeon]RDJ39098.1 MAG: mevalonate kinase [Thermoproteota archaeon]
MKSTASAPGKVILFGEHFVVHGTKAILCSIDKRVTVSSEIISDKKIIVKSDLGQISVNSSEPISKIKSSFKPFIFIAKKMMEEFNHNAGISIEINSEIPSGVGLGSSSACCVAAAGSISALFSKLSKEKIVQLSIDAEKTVFERASGADTTISAHGGIIEYDMGEFHPIKSKISFSLVIANSTIIHSTSKVVTKVNEFRKKNNVEFSELCNQESKLIQKAQESIMNNDIVSLGKCMNENQMYLEKIGVSNEKLQAMIAIAERSSFGAKITGAGGGGCIIALVNDSNINETLQNLKQEKYECFTTKIGVEGLNTF